MGDKFKGIYDFLERVNMTTCNRKAIESLVYAGAFDAFPDIKREQFFAINSKEEVVLDSMIKYGNLYQQDTLFNQNSLFGVLEDAVEIAKPEIPYVQEWSPLVKLNREREMIGMYLSAHPMDEFEFELNNICNATTQDLQALTKYPMGTGLKIGGIVTSFRNGTTKAGRPYGIITLEDYYGSYDIALFGKNYEDYSKYMIKDLFIYLHGGVQERGADRRYYRSDQNPNAKPEPELRIVNIMPFKEVRKMVKKLKISIFLQKLTHDFIEELSDLVLKNKGTVTLHIEVKDFYTLERVSLFSRHHRLKITSEVYKFLKQAEADEQIRYKIEMK